jgi:formylmethanofuran dehydrogenase subunit D
MKFGKFIKRAVIEVVIARNSHQGEVADNKLSEKFREESAVIYLHPNFAKKMGFREGDVVVLERNERKVNVRVRYSETSPEEGGMMPNSIFSNYLTDNLKGFTASISPAGGELSRVEDIIKKI